MQIVVTYYVQWIFGCKCSEGYPPNMCHVQNLGGFDVRADYQSQCIYILTETDKICRSKDGKHSFLELEWFCFFKVLKWKEFESHTRHARPPFFSDWANCFSFLCRVNEGRHRGRSRCC